MVSEPEHDADASQDGGGFPKMPRNRKVKCKGRTVIRRQDDGEDWRRGDPILDYDGARTYRPCEGWGANGTDYCSAHGGSAPQTINAAKRTLALTAEDVANMFASIVRDERISPADRIKAGIQVMDRIGIRSGVDIGLDAPKWQGILSKMFGTPIENAIEDVLAAREETAEEPPPVAKPANATPRKPPARRASKPKPSAKGEARPKFEGW